MSRNSQHCTKVWGQCSQALSLPWDFLSGHQSWGIIDLLHGNWAFSKLLTCPWRLLCGPQAESVLGCLGCLNKQLEDKGKNGDGVINSAFAHQSQSHGLNAGPSSPRLGSFPSLCGYGGGGVKHVDLPSWWHISGGARASRLFPDGTIYLHHQSRCFMPPRKEQKVWGKWLGSSRTWRRLVGL